MENGEPNCGRLATLATERGSRQPPYVTFVTFYGVSAGHVQFVAPNPLCTFDRCRSAPYR
jgi:hypothetical protein